MTMHTIISADLVIPIICYYRILFPPPSLSHVDNVNGCLYTFSVNGNMSVTKFNALTNQATVDTVEEFILSNNHTAIILTSDGSGQGPLTNDKSNTELLYAVLHNYAYIVMDTRVLVVNLNTSNPPYLSYDTLEVGHKPNTIKAFTINGDTFVTVTYVTPELREYLRRFRKYDNSVWGYHGGIVLVVTPNWYNLTLLSNTLIYKATDSLSNYVDTIWVAVAQEWYIYTQDLIDGTTRTFSTPEPCNTIQRLVYSQHRQRMLVQCKEATVFFDARAKEFYKLWSDVVGTAYIAEGGGYGAVVDQSATVLTVLHLHGNYQSLSLKVRGEVQNVVFVDAGSHLHYICYVELLNESYGVDCIQIEQFFHQNSTDYSTNLIGYSSDCPTFYSQKHVLIIEQTNCASDETCSPSLRVFDMLTLTNTHNVTGVDAAFITFKALKTNPPTEVPSTTADTTAHAPTTTTPPSAPTTTITPPQTPTTTAAAPSNSELFMQCSMELEYSRMEYHTLLLTTVTLCCVFSLALLMAVLVLVIIIVRVKTTSHKEEKPPTLTDVKHSDI